MKIESVKDRMVFPQINAEYFQRKSASFAGKYFSYFRTVKNIPL